MSKLYSINEICSDIEDFESISAQDLNSQYLIDNFQNVGFLNKYSDFYDTPLNNHEQIEEKVIKFLTDDSNKLPISTQIDWDKATIVYETDRNPDISEMKLKLLHGYISHHDTEVLKNWYPKKFIAILDVENMQIFYYL